jgi:hypothetical protein
MPEPIWVDANVVSHIVNGDSALESQLKTYSTSGHKLLIVPQARHELLYGNPLTMKPGKPAADQQPSPETRVKMEQTMSRLQIEVDMEGGKLPPSQRVGLAMQDQVKRPKNAAVSRSLTQISESDSLVLSQVKAGGIVRGIKDPTIMTCEQGTKAVVSQATNYGVKVIQLKAAPPSSAPSGGGGGSAAPALGGAGSKLPGAKGLSGAQIQAIHTVIRNGLSTVSMEKAGSQAWTDFERVQNQLLNELHSHPGMGARVIFFFRHNPPVNNDFNSTWAYDGLNWELAVSDGPLKTPWPHVERMSEREERRPIQIWLPPDPTATTGLIRPGVLTTEKEFNEMIATFVIPPTLEDIKKALDTASNDDFPNMRIKVVNVKATISGGLLTILSKKYGARGM